MDTVERQRWGIEWQSDSRLDGRERYLLWDEGLPLLFLTRREAREYINARYGYIRERKDLRKEPFGWKIPKAKRVLVTIKEAQR